MEVGHTSHALAQPHRPRSSPKSTQAHLSLFLDTTLDSLPATLCLQLFTPHVDPRLLRRPSLHSQDLKVPDSVLDKPITTGVDVEVSDVAFDKGYLMLYFVNGKVYYNNDPHEARADVEVIKHYYECAPNHPSSEWIEDDDGYSEALSAGTAYRVLFVAKDSAQREEINSVLADGYAYRWTDTSVHTNTGDSAPYFIEVLWELQSPSPTADVECFRRRALQATMSVPDTVLEHTIASGVAMEVTDITFTNSWLLHFYSNKHVYVWYPTDEQRATSAAFQKLYDCATNHPPASWVETDDSFADAIDAGEPYRLLFLSASKKESDETLAELQVHFGVIGKAVKLVQSEGDTAPFYIELLGESIDQEAAACERRRLTHAGVVHAPQSEAAWNSEWTHRFECWWMGLPMPTQTQLGACMGALGLHVGSRFNALLGRPPPAGAAETNCEWIEQSAGELAMPDLPSLGEFDFTVPPIPRLVPSWERLQVLAKPGAIVAAARPTAASSTQTTANTVTATQRVMGAPIAAGAGAGAGAAAIAMCAYAAYRRMSTGRVAVVSSRGVSAAGDFSQ